MENKNSIIKRIKKKSLELAVSGMLWGGALGMFGGWCGLAYYGYQFSKEPDSKPIAEIGFNQKDFQRLSPQSKYYSNKALQSTYLHYFAAVPLVLGALGSMTVGRRKI